MWLWIDQHSVSLTYIHIWRTQIKCTNGQAPSTALEEKNAMFLLSRGLGLLESFERGCGSHSPVRELLSTWVIQESEMWKPAVAGGLNPGSLVGLSCQCSDHWATTTRFHLEKGKAFRNCEIYVDVAYCAILIDDHQASVVEISI